MTDDQLPDEVWDAAYDAYLNAEGAHGTTAAIRAAVEAAFEAGRESAWSAAEAEFGVQVAANRALAFRSDDRDVAKAQLDFYREIWGDQVWLVERRQASWREVQA